MAVTDPVNLDGANTLITGRSGSFGKQFLSRVLHDFKPEQVIVFSRHEHNQFQMRQRFPATDYSRSLADTLMGRDSVVELDAQRAVELGSDVAALIQTIDALKRNR